jgi:hypothetical protein
MVITLKIDSNVKKSGLNSVYFYVSQGKSGSISQMRKKIYVGLDVSIKQFDLKNFRAKSRHANFQIINKRLDELRVLMSTSQTKFEASQYTVEQVILHLKGEADAESVDSYIETFVKSQKSKKTTYTDYKYTLSAFKKHIGYNKERPITFNEFSNYSLLLKFKNNAQANGVRATSINSYFKKIIVIVLMLFTALGYAQVGVNTNNPDASAALDITSTTGGLLPPRMTTTERDAISPAATGLIVFNTTLNTLQINEGDATTANWVSLSAAATSPTYTVNTFYAELGGYVIQISPNGKHGLVVAMQDQGNSNWYEANDLLSNASNHDADGKEFSDWRLPTKRELSLMYVQRISIGGFDLSGQAPTYSFYWSSTEYDYGYALIQYFANGDQDFYFIKDNSFNVRAVRAF